MACTVRISKTSVGGVVANATLNFQVAITNDGAETVTIQSVQVAELSSTGAQITQPYILTPNVAPGEGNPTIASAATSYFPFQVVPVSPNTPGASPNAPNALTSGTQPPKNPQVILQCVVMSQDNVTDAISIDSHTLPFPALSAVAPFPVPAGGALQFDSPADAVNYFFL